MHAALTTPQGATHCHHAFTPCPGNDTRTSLDCYARTAPTYTLPYRQYSTSTPDSTLWHSRRCPPRQSDSTHSRDATGARPPRKPTIFPSPSLALTPRRIAASIAGAVDVFVPLALSWRLYRITPAAVRAKRSWRDTLVNTVSFGGVGGLMGVVLLILFWVRPDGAF